MLNVSGPSVVASFTGNTKNDPVLFTRLNEPEEALKSPLIVVLFNSVQYINWSATPTVLTVNDNIEPSFTDEAVGETEYEICGVFVIPRNIPSDTGPALGIARPSVPDVV